MDIKYCEDTKLKKGSFGSWSGRLTCQKRKGSCAYFV